MEESQRGTPEFRMDQASLYREEIFTDLKMASIRRLTPVKQDGSLDKSRETLFVAQSQVMTQAGPIPIQAPLQAANLQEAIERCPIALKRELEHMLEEIEELRRKEASRIVVPGVSSGKIHMP